MVGGRAPSEPIRVSCPLDGGSPRAGWMQVVQDAVVVFPLYPCQASGRNEAVSGRVQGRGGRVVRGTGAGAHLRPSPMPAVVKSKEALGRECLPRSGGRGCPGPAAGLLYPGIHWPPSLSGQLVGTEDALLQQLADSMLKADCTSELKV